MLSDNLFRDFVAHYEDAILGINARGIVVYANSQADYLLSLTCNQIVDASFEQFIVAEDHERVRRAIRSAAGGGRGRLDGLRVHCMDGSDLTLSMRYGPIGEPGGSFTGLFGILEHASQVRETESQLVQQQVWYQAVLASTLEPLIIIDSLGIVQLASDSVERLFGWTPAEVVGKNISMLMPEPHRSEHDNYLARFRRTGQTSILGTIREFEAVRKDGSIFPCDVSVSRVDLPDRERPMFAGIIRDATERKRYEAELQRLNRTLEEKNTQLEEFVFNAEKLATLGKLAASIAHEIRNPLTSIKLRLYSIQKAVGGDPSLDKKFKVVSEEIQRLNSVVENFLEFSRTPQLKLRMHDVTVLVDRTLELLSHRFTETGTQLVRRNNGQLPPLHLDADQMKQVFLNLLTNAVEATGRGGRIEVKTGVELASSGCPMVVVRFSDNGGGIPKDSVEKAFEPFFSTKPDGTGLGLCISSRIIQSHGGTLELESTSPQGTTFAVWMPIADGAS